MRIYKGNKTFVGASFVRQSVRFNPMFIDVVRPENWEELNDQVKVFLSLPTKSRARSYRGLAQAVFEVSQSTAQFMAHKKSVGFVLGQTPVFEGLLPYYYKETYEVQTLKHLDMQDPKAWVDELKKDTNFVVFSEDHPVTGEVYPYVEELDRLLNEKRIFSFRVSHSKHYFDKEELRPYSVRFCSYGPHTCVAVVGERYRAPSLLAHTMEWEAKQFVQSISQAINERSVDQTAVEQFEKDVAAVAKIFLPTTATRLFDRALCVLPDVSADAVAEVLFAKMNLSPEEGWSQIATTNMCHWSAVKMFGHWWLPTPSIEDLRGMLIVSTKALKTKDFAKLLISSYEEVKAQQSWNV